MRTAIVSDLHLGGFVGEDLLRDAAIRRALLEEIGSADRVVLLGDVLELRELPLASVLEIARPFFEELGEAMGGGEVLLVPGNHDHRLAEPLLEGLALSRRAGARASSIASAPRWRRPCGSTAGSARPSSASPTRAPGCATTSTPPTATTWTATCPCRGWSASRRRR